MPESRYSTLVRLPSSLARDLCHRVVSTNALGRLEVPVEGIRAVGVVLINLGSGKLEAQGITDAGLE